MRFPPLLTAGKGEIIVAHDKDSSEAPVEVLASELSHGLKSCRTILDDYRAKIGSKSLDHPDQGATAKKENNIGSRRLRRSR